VYASCVCQRGLGGWVGPAKEMQLYQLQEVLKTFKTMPRAARNVQATSKVFADSRRPFPSTYLEYLFTFVQHLQWG
jgi:hypothetical protein